MNDVECEHGLVRETIVVVDDLERLERCLVGLDDLEALERCLASLREVLDEASRRIGEARQWYTSIGMETRELHARMSGLGPSSTLTARESRVAMMVAAGFSNETIARQLHVSVYTVKSHLKGLFAKLGVHSRWEIRHLLQVQGTNLAVEPRLPSP